MRSALLVVSALLLAGAVPAGAAKPGCHLIPDDRGDAATLQGIAPGTPGDDLLSADLAGDARTLTAVMRMDALPAQDPAAPFGRSYLLQARPDASKETLYLAARTGPLGTTYEYGYVGVDAAGRAYTYRLGAARGRLDPVRREVHVSTPTSGFRSRAAVRLGTRLHEPTVFVYRRLSPGLVPNSDVGGVTLPLATLALAYDDAVGRAYVVGAPSCVRVGS